MKILFAVLLVCYLTLMWAITASGGSPHHGGAWIAALLVLPVCLPWGLALDKFPFLLEAARSIGFTGSDSAIGAGIAGGINLVIVGWLTVKSEMKAAEKRRLEYEARDRMWGFGNSKKID